MNFYIYKIIFDRTSFELNEDYERLSEHEKENISDMDTQSFFDYQDHNDNYICFIITSPLEVKRYLEILSRNFITHQLKDLSKDIIGFKIDIEEELRPLLSTTNSLKYSFFIDDLNYWISINLDIDTVLDRISEVGMDNLSLVEKKFLKNYNS